MYSIRKRFDVSIGHRLSKHSGKCKNPHGHNIVIEVQLQSETLNEDGMIIDFTKFKEVVNSVIEHWDHTYFQNISDKFQLPEEFKSIKMPEEPTAENLCKYLYLNLKARFPKTVEVVFVRIWESKSSMAQYHEVSI